MDDHPFMRVGVKLTLSHEGFEVVGEAENGLAAVELARELLPDLIILDLSIPGLDGLGVLEQLNAPTSGLKVLVLTEQPANYYSSRCMSAGALGFVSKRGDLAELTNAALALMNGYTYFPQSTFNSDGGADMEISEARRIASLSDRERLVFQQLLLGLSSKEISERTNLSSNTIGTYKSRVFAKLKVRSLVDLASMARRNGLL
ncbi:response regulator transcription factor [Pseudomonas sp. SCB32]|uniref:response regulator transcription factor n=1 Tax=Pseudomonas sp. SCB32 TaxID=2653853 RepID=UPI00273F0E5C|nr:response regulator transcription factor [Pseudomonas sp. SCB32]